MYKAASFYPWIVTAKKYIGTKEFSGQSNNPKIFDWWRAIKSHFRDDSVPWCAAFVGGVLVESGLPSSQSAAARSYMNYGLKLSGPAVGCIVTFWRGNPEGATGHVGFVVGRDDKMNLMVLGGNQGDMVCVKPFDTGRVLTFNWPKGYIVPTANTMQELPIVLPTDPRAPLSQNEA